MKEFNFYISKIVYGRGAVFPYRFPGVVGLQLRGGLFFWIFTCLAFVALYTPCIRWGFSAFSINELCLLIKKKKKKNLINSFSSLKIQPLPPICTKTSKGEPFATPSSAAYPSLESSS